MRTKFKRAVLWCYEHRWIPRRVAQMLIDAMGLRLA